MKCRNCTAALKRIKYAGANVHECPNCFGHLVEKRSIARIEKRIDKDIDELKDEVLDSSGVDLAEKIRCPRCRNKMRKETVRKPGFQIDECDNCDFVWFDGGELASLQLVYESKGQTQELNGMRERLESMTAAQRKAYEDRIANLVDLGSPMEQAIREATFELTMEYYGRAGFFSAANGSVT